MSNSRKAFEQALNKQAVVEEDLDDLRAALDEIRDSLNVALDRTREAIRVSRRFGGEIKRVVGGQLESYLVGTLEEFIESRHQPGSISSLLEVIDQLEERAEMEAEEEVSINP